MILEVYATKIKSPLDDKTFNYLLNLVDEKKKNLILNQKIKKNSDNTLVGILLAKTGIKNIFGINLKDLDFRYTENGKPYLLNYPNIYFNISHSKNMIVTAISDVPIGIDIEQIQKFDYRLSKKIFGDKITNKIATSQSPDKEFTLMWTKKEAVLKLKGTGVCDIRENLLESNYNIKSIIIEDYCLSVATYI